MVAEKWVKMNYLDHGKNRKVLCNDKNYMNVQYENNYKATFRENPKTQFSIKLTF